MALRKPLVQVNGQIQQLQSGDTLEAQVTEVDLFTMQNNNVGAITKGQPVYCDGAGTVDLAQANAGGTTKPIGLVYETSIASASTGSIQLDGVIEQSDWTDVIGTTNLTAGAEYFLDTASPGMMTETCPTTSGNYIVKMGKALSTTQFEISIQPSILL